MATSNVREMSDHGHCGIVCVELWYAFKPPFLLRTNDIMEGNFGNFGSPFWGSGRRRPMTYQKLSVPKMISKSALHFLFFAWTSRPHCVRGGPS